MNHLQKAVFWLPHATIFYNSKYQKFDVSYMKHCFYPGEETSFSTTTTDYCNELLLIITWKEGLSVVNQGFLCLIIRRVEALSFSFQLFQSHMTVLMSIIICVWFHHLCRATLLRWPMYLPSPSLLLCVFVSHCEIVKLPLPLVDDLSSFVLTVCFTFRKYFITAILMRSQERGRENEFSQSMLKVLGCSYC